MFSQLVLPLHDSRSIRIVANFVEKTASAAYRRHQYEFTDVDVIVLEGIFLLTRQLRGYYDPSFWIDCSFETALHRAIARAQEGLSPQATMTAYRTIYFPAQRIHMMRDKPRVGAAIIQNDDDDT
jgi:uridine kinase